MTTAESWFWIKSDVLFYCLKHHDYKTVLACLKLKCLRYLSVSYRVLFGYVRIRKAFVLFVEI